MAELVGGADAFGFLVSDILSGATLFDPGEQILEHADDDWNEKLINTERSPVKYAFRSSQGSTLSGNATFSETDTSFQIGTSTSFKSFDGDTLTYSAAISGKQTESAASGSAALTLTLASGRGTREKDDDVNASLKLAYKSSETETASSESGSVDLTYKDGAGASFSIKATFSGTSRETESSFSESGRSMVSVTYADADGNRILLTGSYTYSSSDRGETESLKIDRLLLVEEGETQFDFSRMTLRDGDASDISDGITELFGSDFSEGFEVPETFEAPGDIFVALSGVLTEIGSSLDI